jgi:hypothetical protein
VVSCIRLLNKTQWYNVDDRAETRVRKVRKLGGWRLFFFWGWQPPLSVSGAGRGRKIWYNRASAEAPGTIRASCFVSLFSQIHCLCLDCSSSCMVAFLSEDDSDARSQPIDTIVCLQVIESESESESFSGIRERK